MPANLPPQYYEAEKEYRAARTPEEKIEALERMLAIMPHHKGTDHLRAELRARIAKLSQEAERQRAAGGRAQLYAVRKEGAGQVVLVGLANSGKSALLRALTGAPAKVGEYPFTTQLPQPAMMPFEDIQVQLVDLPPVVPGETPGWQRALIRQADLLLLVVDLSADPLSEVAQLLGELERIGLKVLASAGPLSTSDAIVQQKRAMVVATKLDLPDAQEISELLRLEYGERLPLIAVSSETGEGLEDLRRRIFETLRIVRVYSKPPGRPPDLARPFVLPQGSTVEDLADTVHHSMRERLRYAVLWTRDRTALRVSRQYVLRDGDIIELRTD